jgi:hypothetical protein
MDLYEDSMKFLMGDLNETTKQRDLYKEEVRQLEQSNVEMKQYAEEISHLVYTQAVNPMPDEEFRKRIINLTTKIINS